MSSLQRRNQCEWSEKVQQKHQLTSQGAEFTWRSRGRNSVCL